MSPTSRLALFTATLIAVVAVGSQPYGVRLSKSMKDMCVCVPARAGLIARSAIAKTQAKSAELFTLKATASQ
jgi:hypothetical protein